MLVQLLPPSRAPREGVERDVRGGTNNKPQTGAPSTPTLAPDPGFDPTPNPSPKISTLTPAAALNPSLRPGFDRITRTFAVIAGVSRLMGSADVNRIKKVRHPASCVGGGPA